MKSQRLYRGVWPQNVGKLAKYSVRFVDGIWKVTVFYEAGMGLRYLAVEENCQELIEQINALKVRLQDQPGGTFYLNEYRHVIVPVRADPSLGTKSHYYFVTRLQSDFHFEFEGQRLTTRPIHPDDTPLKAGERWVGPRPGIPYALAAGGDDIRYKTPALTDEDPPKVRPMTTQHVKLSKVLGSKTLARRAAELIARIRGHQGGRFYVNEHGAIFTPVADGDGDGINYIYCGQIDRSAWFPEPQVEEND